jgi:hypothetical protein
MLVCCDASAETAPNSDRTVEDALLVLPKALKSDRISADFRLCSARSRVSLSLSAALSSVVAVVVDRARMLAAAWLAALVDDAAEWSVDVEPFVIVFAGADVLEDCAVDADVPDVAVEDDEGVGFDAASSPAAASLVKAAGCVDALSVAALSEEFAGWASSEPDACVDTASSFVVALPSPAEEAGDAAVLSDVAVSELDG